MATRVKLNHFMAFLSDAPYPLSRTEAIHEYGDVILLLADGEQNLGDLLMSSSVETFESVDEFVLEVMTLLPRAAVGEPYQSEGEG